LNQLQQKKKPLEELLFQIQHKKNHLKEKLLLKRLRKDLRWLVPPTASSRSQEM
jgi:hypothetical protein